MLNSRSIQGIVVLIGAFFLSIWLGMALVTSQTETLLNVSVVAVLLGAAFLGRKIWLMFIFLHGMDVMLYRVLGTSEIGQILLIGFSLVLFLMRKLHYQIRFGELELWILLIGACILQAYMRFPVGVSVFGATNVGGRPYVVLTLGLVSAMLLSILRVPPHELKWAMNLSIIGGFLGIPAQLARYGTLRVLGEGAARIPSFQVLGIVIARWLASRISPLRACLHPLWGLLLLASVAFAAASGFRNAVAAVGFIYIIAIYYHGGWGAMLGSMVIGAFALLLLALINLNFPLPGPMQRALSPLPGSWEEQYVDAANRSTEWRVEMWIEALTTDKWIQNKLLGDGIGMSAEELEYMSTFGSSNLGRETGGITRQQENMLISGSYHSGPVHSIRMVGYVGFFILLAAMVRLAVHAHRQIMRCKGTEWAPVALFFCIPIIAHPFFFTLVFGEYHFAVVETVLGMAMVRLMERNLPLPAYVVRSRREYVPLVTRNRVGEVQNARSA